MPRDCSTLAAAGPIPWEGRCHSSRRRCPAHTLTRTFVPTSITSLTTRCRIVTRSNCATQKETTVWLAVKRTLCTVIVRLLCVPGTTLTYRRGLQPTPGFFIIGYMRQINPQRVRTTDDIHETSRTITTCSALTRRLETLDNIVRSHTPQNPIALSCSSFDDCHFPTLPQVS